MDHSDTVTKRFFALDTQTYQAGALNAKQKELMGLVSSVVLRCDDCILYHLIRSKEEGVTDSELIETADIALIVGGSITIPHLRRMFDKWTELKKMEEK
jgi:AhpD family alkylhydroperoxidase